MNKMNRINVCISSSLICLILLLDIHENSPVECRALEKSAKLNKAEANKALMVSKEAVDKRLKEPDVPSISIQTLLLSAMCSLCKGNNDTCRQSMECFSRQI